MGSQELTVHHRGLIPGRGPTIRITCLPGGTHHTAYVPARRHHLHLFTLLISTGASVTDGLCTEDHVFSEEQRDDDEEMRRQGPSLCDSTVIPRVVLPPRKSLVLLLLPFYESGDLAGSARMMYCIPREDLCCSHGKIYKFVAMVHDALEHLGCQIFWRVRLWHHGMECGWSGGKPSMRLPPNHHSGESI
ncbi:hypothetical protein Tco_0878388 [Tanacetum coccineum]|uniref:Uncharacterized protein n=1 Tax=Tanacetum coccineum TaxID=301880 RepID=A0ABQ5C0Q1_9ASTR